jgi:hypothetical protein
MPLIDQFTVSVKTSQSVGDSGDLTTFQVRFGKQYTIALPCGFTIAAHTPKHSARIAIFTNAIALLHFLAKAVSKGIGINSSDTFQLARHFRNFQLV